MKSTVPVARWALLLFLLAVALPLFAVSGVTVWENTFHPADTLGEREWLLAARELVDGTTLTVVGDNFGLTTLHYDHSGNRLGTATFYSAYPRDIPQTVAIDSFGAVFVGSLAHTPNTEIDIWLMKFDGLTGAGLWPAAVIFGAGNQSDDIGLQFFLDRTGDLIMVSQRSISVETVVTKFRGTDGQVLWGGVKGPYSYVAAVDPSGDVYLLRDSLTKYSGSTGAIVWQTVSPTSAENIGFDAAGDVVLVGNPPGQLEAVTYSGRTGQEIWGPAIWTSPTGAVSLAAATVGSDGSVVISGATFEGSQIVDQVLLKFRGADGALQWGPVLASVGALTLAGDGDPILSGSVADEPGGGSPKIKTWRYDSNSGSLLWEAEVSSSSEYFDVVFVESNGNVYQGLAGIDDTPAVILELDGATGAPAWGPANFTGVAAGLANLLDLTASADGNVVATGQVELSPNTVAWATLKFDRTTGAVLWGPMLFGSSSITYASPWKILCDASGDVVVAGQTDAGTTLVKYSGSTGAELWNSALAPPVDFAGFVFDPNDDVIVGASGGTVKVSGATGTVVWGPVTSVGFPFPNGIATDPSGNVVVATYDQVSKLAASDGSIIWFRVLQTDTVVGLAVDSAGNILRESSGGGITTMKLSGATGETMWGPVTVGDAASATPVALALEPSGNIIVAGGVSNGANVDYALIKYRDSDGSVLWGPVTYDGGGDDVPFKVVVDGSGNAVVTGTSDAGEDELKTATLSYDGVTGALRWGPVGRNIARNEVNGLSVSGSTVYVGATRGDLGYVVDAIDETLGIATLPGALPAASCGHALVVSLGAVNGTPPYSWSIVGGGLPPAVVLGASGDIIGTPSEEGVFFFRVQVQDSVLATATRDFTLAVGPGGPLVAISVARDPATCQLTLSTPGSYSSYEWLPGGESTPTIVVNPAEPTTYGVVLDDGSTCAVRGAVTITPFDPACLAPTLATISPSSGPGAGTPVVLTGTKFDPSAALAIGGQPGTGVVVGGATSISAETPALAPATVADVLVVNPDGRYAMLPRSFASDFLDVPSSNPFYGDIMKVLRAGITAGCGNGSYCPLASVSRAQMAVFLLKAQHGFFHVPPACTGVFADVPCPAGFAVDWIEELAAEGITGGCGAGNYCPNGVVTRAQMSALLLRTEHGPSYQPPSCAGIFGDVPCPGPFADWIERLYQEGITGGCGGGDYCPSSSNTRGQMGVFLTKTFLLP